MLKKILVSYLLRKCGNFVDGINQNALETDFWNGKVALRDLKFRADLLESFNLPFNFELTHVGRLELTIPWSSVLSSSVVVEVSDVTLLASTSQPWLRPHFEVERIRELVRERLLAKLLQLDFGEEDGSTADEGRVAQALRKIVQRIVVRFRNFHFRLEICKETKGVEGTKRIQEFASTPVAAVGFFTDRISSSPSGTMQTRVATCQLCTLYTDVRSRNLLGISRSLCLQKLQLVCSNLQSLSDPENLREIVRIQGIEVHLQSTMPAQDHKVAAQEGNQNKPDHHRERLKHEVSVAQVSVRLTTDSIRIVQLVLRHMQKHDHWWRQVNYRAQFRPEQDLSTPSNSPSKRKVLLRSWWHYALELAKRPTSWTNTTAGESAAVDESHNDHGPGVHFEPPSMRRTIDWYLVRRASQDRRSYVLAFRKRLQKQKTKQQSKFNEAGYSLRPVASLPAPDQKTLRMVEQRYDVPVVAVFRRVALAQHQKSTVIDQRSSSDEEEPVNGGWFGWLWGSEKSSLASTNELQGERGSHAMAGRSSTPQLVLHTQVQFNIERLWAELAMPQLPHASRDAVLQLTSGLGCNLTVDELSGLFECALDLSHKTMVQLRETQAAYNERTGYGDEIPPSNRNNSSHRQSPLSTRTLFFFDPLVPDQQKSTSSVEAGVVCHLRGGSTGTITAGRMDEGDHSAIQRRLSVEVSTRPWTAEMTLDDVSRFLALAEILQHEYEGHMGDSAAERHPSPRPMNAHDVARSNLHGNGGGGGGNDHDKEHSQRNEISASSLSVSLISPSGTVRILLPEKAREVPNSTTSTTSTASASSAVRLAAELQVSSLHLSIGAAVNARGLIGKGRFCVDLSKVRAELGESCSRGITSSDMLQDAQTKSDLKAQQKRNTALGAVTDIHCLFTTDTGGTVDKAQSGRKGVQDSSVVRLRSITLELNGDVTCALSTNAVARVSEAMACVSHFFETQKAHASVQLTPAASVQRQSPSSTASSGPLSELARLAPHISFSMRRLQCTFECERATSGGVGELVLSASLISVAVASSSKSAFKMLPWTLAAQSVTLRHGTWKDIQRPAAQRPTIFHVSAMTLAMTQNQEITNLHQTGVGWNAEKVKFSLIYELVPDLLEDVRGIVLCLQTFNSSGGSALTPNGDLAATHAQDAGSVRPEPEHPDAVSLTVDVDDFELALLRGEDSDHGLSLASRGFEFALPCAELSPTSTDSASTSSERLAFHSKLQFDTLSLLERRGTNKVNEVAALVCGGRPHTCVVEENGNSTSVKVSLADKTVVRIASVDAVLGCTGFLSDFAQLVDAGQPYPKTPSSLKQPPHNYTAVVDSSGLSFQLGFKEAALRASIKAFSVQGAATSSGRAVDSPEMKFHWRAKFQGVEVFCARFQFCYLHKLHVKYEDPTFSKGLRISSSGLHLWLSVALAESLFDGAVWGLLVPTGHNNASAALPKSGGGRGPVAHQSPRRQIALSLLKTCIVVQSTEGAAPTNALRYTSLFDSLTLLFESNHDRAGAAVAKIQSGSVFMSACASSSSQSHTAYFQAATGGVIEESQTESGLEVASPVLFLLFGKKSTKSRHRNATVAGLKLVAVVSSFLHAKDLCSLAATCTYLHRWNQLTPLTRVPTVLVQERSNFEWRRDAAGTVLKIWIGSVSLWMQLQDVVVARDLNDKVSAVLKAAYSPDPILCAGDLDTPADNVSNDDLQSFVVQIQMSGGDIVWMPPEANAAKNTMRLPSEHGDKSIVASVGKIQLGMSWFPDGSKTFQLKMPNSHDRVTFSLLQRREGLVPTPAGFEVQALSVKHIFRKEDNSEDSTNAWKIALSSMTVELAQLVPLADVAKSEYGIIRAFSLVGRDHDTDTCDIPASPTQEEGSASAESLQKPNEPRFGKQTISFDCHSIDIGLFKAVGADDSKLLDVVRGQVGNFSGTLGTSSLSSSSSSSSSFDGALSAEASAKSLALLYRGCTSTDRRAGVGAWEKAEFLQIQVQGTRAARASPLNVSCEAANCSVQILHLGLLHELSSAIASARGQLLRLIAFEDWVADSSGSKGLSSFDSSQFDDGKSACGTTPFVDNSPTALGRAHISKDAKQCSFVVEYDGCQPLGIRLEKIVRPKDGVLLGARVVAVTSSDKAQQPPPQQPQQPQQIEVNDELVEFRDRPVLGMNFSKLLAGIRATTSSSPSRLLFRRRLSQPHDENRAPASDSSTFSVGFLCRHSKLSFLCPFTTSSVQLKNDTLRVRSFAMMTFDSTRVAYSKSETSEEQVAENQSSLMSVETHVAVRVWDGTRWFSCLDPTELKCRRTQTEGLQPTLFVHVVTDLQLNVTPAALLQLNNDTQSFLHYNSSILKSQKKCPRNCTKDTNIDVNAEADTMRLILADEDDGVEVFNTLGYTVDIALGSHARFDAALSQTAWKRLDQGKSHTLSWKISSDDMVEEELRAQRVLRVRIPLKCNLEAANADAAHHTRRFEELQIATESCDGTFCKFLSAQTSFGDTAGKEHLRSGSSDFLSEREIPIAWTINVADSGRVMVQLHSTLLFENHLGTPVDLYFPPTHNDRANTMVHGETHTINAGDRLSLPALEFGARCYHIRPHCVPSAEFANSSAYSDLLAASAKSNLLNELELYLVYAAFGADHDAACEWCARVCAMDDTKKARQEISNLILQAGFQFNEGAALQVGQSQQSTVCIRNQPLHKRSLPHLCHIAHSPLVYPLDMAKVSKLISFRAPIEVINSMPYPVEVVVRSNGNSSASRVVHRVLRSGDRCAVTAFHVRARPQIRVRMLWYAWSRWEDILLVGSVDEGSKETGSVHNGNKTRDAQTRARGPRPQFLECQDQTSMVCVSMLNRPGPAGNRIVTLFSRYVLRRAASSQLALAFGHSTAAENDVAIAGRSHSKTLRQSQSEMRRKSSTVKKKVVDTGGSGNRDMHKDEAVQPLEGRSGHDRAAMFHSNNNQRVITCRAGMPTSDGGFVVAVENQVFDRRALRWIDVDQMPAEELAQNKNFQLTALLRKLEARKVAPLPHDKHWAWESTWEPISARLLPLHAIDVKEQTRHHASTTLEGNLRDGWWYAAKFKHMFQPWRQTSGVHSSGARSRGSGLKSQATMRSDFAEGFYCRSRFVRRKFGFVDGLKRDTAIREDDDAACQKQVEDAISKRFYPEARKFAFPWKQALPADEAAETVNATESSSVEHVSLLRAVCHHRYLHVRVGCSQWSAGVDLEALQPGGEPCEVTVFGSFPWPGRASTVHVLLVEKRSTTNVDTGHRDYVANIHKQRPALALTESQGHDCEASTCEIVVRSKLRLQNAAFGQGLPVSDDGFPCRRHHNDTCRGHIFFRQQGTLNTDGQVFCASHGETVDYCFSSHLEVPALQLAVQMVQCQADRDSTCSATQADAPLLWSKCFRVDQHADFALRVPCSDSTDAQSRTLILRIHVDNGHVVVTAEAENPLCVVQNHSSRAVEFLESSALATAAVRAGTGKEVSQAVDESGGWSLCKPGQQANFGWLDVHNRGFLVVRPAPASDCQVTRDSSSEEAARVATGRAASSRDWVKCQMSSRGASTRLPGKNNTSKNKTVYWSRSKALRVEIARFGTAFHAEVFDSDVEPGRATTQFEEEAPGVETRRRTTSTSTGGGGGGGGGVSSDFHVQVQADGVLGLSVMTDELEELLLLTLTGTTGALRWLSRSNEITCVAASQRLQVDCFLPLSHFPVVLHSQQSNQARRGASVPVATKRAEKAATQAARWPDVRFNFKGRSHAGQLRHVDFFHLTVGPMCANVDGRLISTLMGSYSPVFAVFSHTPTSTSTVGGQTLGCCLSRAARMEDDVLNNQMSATTPLVWETVIVDEVSVKLNFATSVDQPGFRARRASLAAFWRSLSSINDANLIFQRFARSSLRCSPLEFGKILLGHMKDLLWNKVLLLAGSMNALGNPLGLLGKVGEGTLDLVAGPLDGARGGGGLDGGIEGGIDGGISLVRNTINGVFQSAGGLTSTLATAAAHASMDPEYIARHSHGSGTVGVDRVDESVGLADPSLYKSTGTTTSSSRGGQRSAKTALDDALQGEPRDVFDGVALGTLTLARGLWDGITDVYTQVRRSTRRRDEGFNNQSGDPGIHQGGSNADARSKNKSSAGKMVGRVMKGVGRGLLGTVVKPTVGVIDAATKVLDGVKNSTRHETEVHQQTRSRTTVRRQRPVYYRGNLVPRVLPYNHDAATVCAVLRWLSFREFGQGENGSRRSEHGGTARSKRGASEVAIGRHDAASFIGHLTTLDGVLVLVTEALLHLSTPGRGEPLKLVARIPWGSIIGFQCSGFEDAVRSHYLRPPRGDGIKDSSFVSKLTIRHQNSGRVAAHDVLTGHFTCPRAFASGEGMSIAMPVAPTATAEATASEAAEKGGAKTPNIAKQATIALQPVLDILLTAMRRARTAEGVVPATTNLWGQPVRRTT